MDGLDIVSRAQGPGSYPDVLTIPTPPLQAVGVFVMFVLPGIACIIFGLRMYTRVSMRTTGVDDLLCGLALFCAIMVSSTLYMFFKLNYYGWEDEKVPEYDPGPGLWWNFVEQLFYNPVLAFVKASILIFLIRLGGGAHSTAMLTIIWSLMAFNIAHAITVFFGALFQCIPMRTNWHPELRADPNTKCIDDSFHIIHSSLAILTDVLILALPFWIFLRLRMSWATKIAVLGVFAIGTLVPAVAIVRLVNIYRLLYLGEKSRHYNIAYVWTAVEVNLAVICCSIPALRPLLGRWWPKVFGASSGECSNRPYSGFGRESKSRSSRVTANKKSPDHDAVNYMLHDLHPQRKQAHTEIRGVSPSGSEEEIMTYEGIMRQQTVQVVYENAQRSGAASRTSSDAV